MSGLSISQAWEESRARIAADGRLIAIVAAALIVLPGIVNGVVYPATEGAQGLGPGLLFLITSLLALIGQLAIIRLAIGPAVSVGEAIGHGARRMPIYLVAGLLLVIAFFLAVIPFVVVAYAAGIPLTARDEAAVAQSPVALVLTLVYLALVCFVAVRMLMSSPVASEEAAGPVAILKRSWDLTAGHWWRLFGFILMFLIGAGIAIAAINWATAFVVAVLFGPVESMSVSALLVAAADSVVNAVVTATMAVILARIYLQLAGRDARSVSVPTSGT